MTPLYKLSFQVLTIHGDSCDFASSRKWRADVFEGSETWRFGVSQDQAMLRGLRGDES